MTTDGILVGVQRIAHPNRIPDREESLDLSLIVLFEGWPDDLLRLHSSASAYLRDDWELVVVDNPTDDEASEAVASLDRLFHVPLRDRVGYGAGRNLGLRLAAGGIVCVVDTSVEVTGDVFAPLREHLDDPQVGVVGRWGVSTSNGFDFEEDDGPDVDGVEGYFIAMRGDDVSRIGGFDAKFKFYRNADLDLSYRVREAGLRTIVDPALPLVRHEHRLWENTPDRDELSRKNFFRFRKRWYPG